MPQYYDGTKLLSMTDINGNKPELYLCTTNRTGGKSTYFGRYVVRKWIEKREKFCLVYRFKYELEDVADKFFKDIGRLFFPEYEMTSKTMAKGVYSVLYLNDEGCGYAIALNTADSIKKLSHIFSDVERMLFDEFQSETNKYCNDEIGKLLSVHTSIARGNHKQVRYVPVYMLGNTVSILNPYYVELGISDRLKDDTKFLRGDGFVLEQGYVESAASAQKESGFNRAFAKHKYVAYAGENVYLNDSRAFIDKPNGRGRYIMTLRYEGTDYGIREYAEAGIVYCDDRADSSYPDKVVVTTEDHNINYVMIRPGDFKTMMLRWYFEHGVFRFKNMKCKEAILKALSY